ncbi:MAG: hypothetical protein CMG49_05500 [Candidatus Marinimicrobia bacterium]|nr:hypothetical protein [Candidatus Neomarinimicrobiota bacterium]
MSTLYIALLLNGALIYHPLEYNYGMNCLETFEHWRKNYTTHTWEKVPGDKMSHGYYVDEGELADAKIIAVYCPTK